MPQFSLCFPKMTEENRFNTKKNVRHRPVRMMCALGVIFSEIFCSDMCSFLK